MFVNIAVIPNPGKDRFLTVSRSAVKILQALGCSVFSPEADMGCGVQVCPTREALEICDFAVTVGGDGTILHIARDAAILKKPIVGINLGRVGFLAEIETHQLSLLNALPERRFIIEKRMMLSCEVLRKGETVFSTFALNDAVLSKGAVSRMIEFDVYSDDQSLHSYRADGIVFASPTGSTAYSLSAGGPVVDPRINCIVLTPVCVHSLFAARSVIFSENSALNIQIKTTDDTPAFLTADGMDNFPLEREDTVVVRRSEYDLDLIRLKQDSFYSVLSNKIK